MVRDLLPAFLESPEVSACSLQMANPCTNFVSGCSLTACHEHLIYNVAKSDNCHMKDRLKILYNLVSAHRSLPYVA